MNVVATSDMNQPRLSGQSHGRISGAQSRMRKDSALHRLATPSAIYLHARQGAYAPKIADLVEPFMACDGTPALDHFDTSL